MDLVSLMNLMTAVNCDVFLGPGTSDHQFHDDLQLFSRTFSILSMGLPEWLPLPALQEALRRRRRLLTAPCVLKHTEKTSNALLSRRRVFLERVGAPGVKHQTFADLGFLWASIVNTNQTTFWVLANLISGLEKSAAIRPFATKKSRLASEKILLADSLATESCRLADRLATKLFFKGDNADADRT